VNGATEPQGRDERLLSPVSTNSLEKATQHDPFEKEMKKQTRQC
jgi:hypothetical protein